jgi:hypothetical protein
MEAKTAFWTFGQATIKAINFWILLKHFEVVNMDCSFSMRCYMWRLDSWFKSNEVLKISAAIRKCCQPLPMQQNVPKTAKIYQNLPKDN